MVVRGNDGGGIPAYAGMTWLCVGMTGWDSRLRGKDVVVCWNDGGARGDDVM